ncbi:hypothetical protein [Hydrogenophaga sp.]|uniref:hypothetical protein n=1 Tax=Hydrogenophaga sp. TaxID=1904254 RepID=UPI003BAECAF0
MKLAPEEAYDNELSMLIDLQNCDECIKLTLWEKRVTAGGRTAGRRAIGSDPV